MAAGSALAAGSAFGFAFAAARPWQRGSALAVGFVAFGFGAASVALVSAFGVFAAASLAASAASSAAWRRAASSRR